MQRGKFAMNVVESNRMRELRAELNGVKALPLIATSKWQDETAPGRMWLLDQWLPLARGTFLTGKGGSGKSLLAQQLATTKTDGSMREIAMNHLVYEALLAQREVTGTLSDYVFCMRSGNPFINRNVTSRIWYPTLRYLGVRPRRPYQTRHTAATLIIGILLGAGMLAVWALISSQTIFRRPASPSYVLVALRSVRPNRRYEFLATLNTVSLRGQRIPFTQWDVLAAVRECSARRVEKEAVEHARTRQAAMLQASLIDAFRGG
jgi:AAA domain